MTGSGRRLVLLRHGRTSWNAEQRVQGQLDSELDEVGLEQARQVAPAIAALGPAVVVSSDLARARATAETVAKEAGLVPAHDERLREFFLGELQGLTHGEIEAVDPVGLDRFRRGDWNDIAGAETPMVVADRMAAALRDLAAQLEPGETGVAVSHGAAIRSGITRLLGWDVAQVGALQGMDNCGWAILDEHPQRGWVLVAYNRTV